MSEFDYRSPFYAEKHTSESLVAGLDSLLTHEDVFVRAIPFGCPQKSIEWLSNAAYGSRYAELVHVNEGVSFFKLHYSWKENHKQRSGHGYFFVANHPEYDDVFTLFSIESSEFYHRALWPFVQGLYPSLLMTFIPHKRLRRLLDDFKTEHKFTTLKITRANQRIRLEAHKQVPLVSWPDLELSEAFDWVQSNDGWFQSLTFEAKRGDETCATVGLTRQGVIKTNRLLRLAHGSFIMPVCKMLHEDMTFFGRRGRRDNPQLEVRPIAIDLETDQFVHVEENARFIGAVRRLKSASVSVVHGNPYVHMSLIDYFDGSTFDLWVLSVSQIVIVPQMKSTIPALKRLVNHIFDDYAEGRITEYDAGQ